MSPLRGASLSWADVVMFGVLATACARSSGPGGMTAEAPASSAGMLAMPVGLDEAAMDRTVSPCDDFYRFACGRWIDRAEIRKDLPMTDRSFIALSLATSDHLRVLLQDAVVGKGPAGTVTKILGDFYGACIDESTHDDSLHLLREDLGRLAAMRDVSSLAQELATLHLRGGEAFFAYRRAVDPDSATTYIAEIDQGGLGLPTRAHYLDNDEKTRQIRGAYRAHIQRVSMLLGESARGAAERAGAVMAIETALARAALGPVDRRDARRLKHPFDSDALRSHAPSFPWSSFFRQVRTAGVVSLNVTNPPTIAAFEELLRVTPWPALRAYLGWRVVVADIEALPRAIRDARFEFERSLTGAEQPEERWRECSRMAEEMLPDAVGEAYVARHFSRLAKQRASEMAQAIGSQLRGDLARVSWMDDATRMRALEKLDSIVLRFGYPETWRSYSDLVLDRGNFLASHRRVREHQTRHEYGKISRPVDRREWRWSATTINMGNSLDQNALTFPAAVLQPPIFDVRAPLAVVFGSAGVFIGHEFTHAFDDQGRQYDARGGTNQWWTEASNAAFLQRAACLKEQFDQEFWIDEVHVNGSLTLGENIADLGGAKLAYAAMMAAPRRPRSDAVSRYSDSQQFFIGYAQVWCSKHRPEFARMLAQVDPHPPPSLRVNMPLRNMPEFQQAFACPAGSRMVRPASERCVVW